MKRHSKSYKTWPKTSFLQNHNFTTEQFARRGKHSPGELTSGLLARRGKHSSWRAMASARQATKNTRCGERCQTTLWTDLSFHHKTSILTTQNPKLIGNITYCYSTSYTSLSYTNSLNYLHFQQSNWIWT